MPILRPEQPKFANGAERQVWRALRTQLARNDLLMSGLRVTDRRKDHEADVVVVMPGSGIVVAEVKGGSVWRDGGRWRQYRGGKDVPIEPVEQARGARYALRNYVETDPRWRSSRRTRVRWAHAVVLPNTELSDEFAAPDCPRWMVVDKNQLSDVAGLLRDVPAAQETGNRAPTDDDVALIAEILQGRGQSQQDVVAVAREHEAEVQRLTQEQAVILGAIRLLNRVEVRGGAGSGKTWLAVEQARRLARDGQRVALLCYSRGLAAFLRKQVGGLAANQRPAWVGEFHSLGHQWGAARGSDDDSDYWENRLPVEMLARARALDDADRYDAVVIDEAQDFADSWWPVLLAALRDEENGGLYVFSDEGQRVFARYGQPPVPLVPLVLDDNLRNTRQIAATFNSLTPIRMRLAGVDGPAVRFVSCGTEDALGVGDDQVELLLEQGWRPGDVALLTTGSRHPEQAERQQGGQDAYWASFWDDDQAFYGHVLGFKGLERRVVVLVVNDTKVSDRARERLYVGLSRARDQLVVCGDAAMIREMADDAVLRAIGA
ncbi:MAG: NERD domain-containing protein [Mycobacteriales bacterium]|nr:MAG: nuclease [Pseudonocardiales bacterium]